jgi:hypothetical protein
MRACALVASVLTGIIAALCAPSAVAAPGLMVGTTDDMFMFEPALARSLARDLGLRATRVTLKWVPGETTLRPVDAAELQHAVDTGVRVVIAVYGWRDHAPQDAASRDAYCSYVRDTLEQMPQINDVVIWNEPNLSLFWRPQFAAGSSASPAAYEALLARCWDVLHALRPNVNVIAPAMCPWGSDATDESVTISHSPVMFIRKLGQAYRATGRRKPIFDTVGHHIYGQSAGERPWREHPFSRRISQGDLGKLVNELQDAFGGSSQPVPGMPVDGRSTPIWYMEAGFESTPDAEKRALYFNDEPPGALPDSLGGLPWTVLPDAASPAPDQASQLRDAVRLAYCQPYVEAFFNFLLRDQQDLNYWQSGVLWADGTPKGSYGAFRDAIAEVSNTTVGCSTFPGSVRQASVLPGEGPQPLTLRPAIAAEIPPVARTRSVASAASDATVPRSLVVQWVRRVRRSYGRHNVEWRVAVRATLAAEYVATVVDRRGRRRLAARGTLGRARVTWISFPRRRLARGRYGVVLKVTAPQSLSLRSGPFSVR